MPVTLERRGAFAVLTLDRQEALNALSFAIIDDIGERLDAVAAGDARAPGRRRSAPAPTSRNCATAAKPPSAAARSGGRRCSPSWTRCPCRPSP